MTTIQKLTTIPNPNYKISYPDLSEDNQNQYDAIDSIQGCLKHKPLERFKIKGGDDALLERVYLKPTPQRSSSLKLTKDASTMTHCTRSNQDAGALLNIAQAKTQDVFNKEETKALTTSHLNKSHQMTVLKSEVQNKENVYINQEPIASVGDGVKQIFPKALSQSIQQQIQDRERNPLVGLNETNRMGAKTLEKKDTGMDMRSALEKRLGEMRKFLDADQDNNTCTSTLDMTGFSGYF